MTIRARDERLSWLSMSDAALSTIAKVSQNKCNECSVDASNTLRTHSGETLLLCEPSGYNQGFNAAPSICPFPAIYASCLLDPQVLCILFLCH